MMKRTHWLLVCLLLLLPALLASCASRKSEVHSTKSILPAERIGLTFFGNKVEVYNVEVIEKILNDYMKTQPRVTISYESAKGNAYFSWLDKRIRSGNLDDVFMVNHDAVLQYGAQGHLLDLSDLPELARFSPLALEQMRDADGGIYYVPTTISAFGLFCNLDLLEAHRQPVPRNYGEFAAVCDYFARKGVTPIIANNDISLKTVALAVSEYPLRANGTADAVYQKLNRGEMRLSAFLQPGLAMVEDWLQRGYVDAAVALRTEKTKDDLAQFARGAAPFMLTGGWTAGAVRNMVNFRFEIHPYPLFDDGSVLVVNADTRLSVNKNGKHVEQAVDFVRFFLREENLDRFVRNQSSFTPLKDGQNPNVSEMQFLYDTLQSGRYIVGANENLNLPIWERSRDAVRLLLRGEAWDAVSAQIDQVKQP